MVVLALATSLLWGTADFGGGLLTRRFSAMSVVVVSQTAAAVVLGAVVVATGGWHEAGPRLWFAVGAGLAGPAAMLCFYRALALGPMGVVSPLATVAVVVPVGVGLLLGERPGAAQYAGIAVALAGVVLAGGPQSGGGAVPARTVGLALGAACGFGVVMALVAQASVDVTGLFLALFVQRLCNVAVGGVMLASAARRGTPVLPAGGAAQVWRNAPLLVFVGLADVAANGSFALAARQGPMTVAAVLASLYPVITALAARIVLGERLRPVQAAGAGLALLGSVLLAAG
jgi:drug/metabolite transporter (DMT)-like permease